MLAARENRTETRVICQGVVRLFTSGVGFQAQLLDVSNNGFRATHCCPDLQPGLEVRFEHRFFVGNARVVWTEDVAGRTQSGFQILRG